VYFLTIKKKNTELYYDVAEEVKKNSYRCNYVTPIITISYKFNLVVSVGCNKKGETLVVYFLPLFSDLSLSYSSSFLLPKPFSFFNSVTQTNQPNLNSHKNGTHSFPNLLQLFKFAPLTLTSDHITMGLCTSKPRANPTLSSSPNSNTHFTDTNADEQLPKNPIPTPKKSPLFPFYTPSPAHHFFSGKSPAPGTPRRFFKPPSPAKHIRAVLARRHGSVKPNEATIPEDEVVALDKNFGFSKQFEQKFEVGNEVGRGHFGYTCAAKFLKGQLKGQQVAVKVIPKAKVVT